MRALIVAAGLLTSLLTMGAGAHAGAATGPVAPQAKRYLLPGSLTGPLALNPHMGVGLGPYGVLANYLTGRAATALVPGVQGLYLYQVAPRLPASSWVGGMYMVAVYSTAEQARQANIRFRDAGRSIFVLDPLARGVPIGHPANATTEWLRGYLGSPSTQFRGGPRDCYAMGGIRAGRLLILAQIDDWGAKASRGQSLCQAAQTWTRSVLEALYTRAQAAH